MWSRKKPEAVKRPPTLTELKKARDVLLAEIASDPDVFDKDTAKHARAKVYSRYRIWFDQFIDRHDPTQEI